MSKKTKEILAVILKSEEIYELARDLHRLAMVEESLGHFEDAMAYRAKANSLLYRIGR